MEQAQPHAVALEHLHQLGLRLVQFPAGGEEAAVLVRIRIAQHHLLRLAARVQQHAPDRNREQAVHDARGVAQVADRFEQRDDIHRRLPLMHVEQADLLQDEGDFQHVGHAVGLRDDVVRQRSLAVQLVHLGGGARDRQLALGFGRELHEGRGQRARRAQFVDQHLDTLLLAQFEVVAADVGVGQQFGDHALVHVGVLAQVECRQVEAEHARGVAQPAQAAARDQRRLVTDQRVVDHVEVAHELFGVAVGVGVTDRLPQRLVLVQRARGDRQAGVDAGQRAAVQLVLAVRRLVRRGGGQYAQFVADVVQQRGRRQVGVEDVYLGQVVIERLGRLHAQRRAQHVGGDEGVAIAVAADP